MKNKKKTPALLKRHFKRRFLERHDIELNDNDVDLIAEQINSGRSEFKKRETIRIEVHKVKHNDNFYIVLFDNKRKMPVTTLQNGERFVEWKHLMGW
jgi:hypothetical protein